MGLVYDRDGFSSNALTGRKADDLRSWHTRQYTQEEADRGCVLFAWFRQGDGCFGVHRQDGGKMDVRPLYLEGQPKGLDAVMVSRCGRSEKMICHVRLVPTQCVYIHGQENIDPFSWI